MTRVLPYLALGAALGAAAWFLSLVCNHIACGAP